MLSKRIREDSGSYLPYGVLDPLGIKRTVLVSVRTFTQAARR
jgi:hypothetical protein